MDEGMEVVRWWYGTWSPDMMFGICAKEFSLCFIKLDIWFLVVQESFRCLLANSKWTVFHLAKVRFPSLKSNLTPLSEWPSGSWLPPWLRLSNPSHSDWPGSQFYEESKWFPNVFIYRWWRLLYSLRSSMLQKFFCTFHQICASIQSCRGGLQTIRLQLCDLL